MSGPELDARIAEEVLGFTIGQDRGGPFILVDGGPKPLPAYSTNISDAMEMMQTLSKRGYGWLLQQSENGSGECIVMLGGRYCRANAETLPLAICQAVLSIKKS